MSNWLRGTSLDRPRMKSLLLTKNSHHLNPFSIFPFYISSDISWSFKHLLLKFCLEGKCVDTQVSMQRNHGIQSVMLGSMIRLIYWMREICENSRVINEPIVPILEAVMAYILRLVEQYQQVMRAMSLHLQDADFEQNRTLLNHSINFNSA